VEGLPPDRLRQVYWLIPAWYLEVPRKDWLWEPLLLVALSVF